MADGRAYCGVGGGKLLLVCRDDSAAALSGVQRTLALHNGLARAGSATTSAAANLGNGVPVFRHVVCEWCVVVRKCESRVRILGDDLKMRGELLVRGRVLVDLSGGESELG